nr:diphthine--ammonia ligase isoform X1 [Ipomoea batatas]
MKVVALVSGGKDSCYAMMKCIQYGHEIVALANLMPADDSQDELDSYMYQTVGHQIVVSYATCMGVPLFRRRIKGSTRNHGLSYSLTPGDEVEDMFILLNEVKRQIPDVAAVSSGAIASDYQRLRVESVCSRLGLVSLGYLWKQDQSLLLHEMIRSGIVAIIVKVAAIGLDPSKHLGKEIAYLDTHLHKLKELYGINVCGEGGEYETLTLDCPLFENARIVLDEFQVILHSSDSIAPVGILHPLSFHLEKKLDSLSSSDSNGGTSLHLGDTSTVYEVLEEHQQNCEANQAMSKLIDVTPEKYDAMKANLKISKSQKDDIYSISCWLQHSETSTSLQVDLEVVLMEIETQLAKHGCSWENVLYIHLYIADMNEFSTANETYVRFITQEKCRFGVPSRSTIELPLLQVGLGRAYMEVLVAQDHSKKVLHVQSISCWAPSCIGPYSQATLHKDILYMAGQLGLDPPTMLLCKGGPTAELQQALVNSEAIARSFNCSISTSAILFIIYCSACIERSNRTVIENEMTRVLGEMKLDQLDTRRTSKVLDPIFLYVLVPDLPKRALVEVKPMLFLAEHAQPPPREIMHDPSAMQSYWGFQYETWHDNCLQKCSIEGQVCAAILSVTEELAQSICSKSIPTVGGDGDLNILVKEDQLKRIAQFCIYRLDKILLENNLSWDDILNFRVYFTTRLNISHRTVSEIFANVFSEFAQIRQGVNITTEPIFNLVPVVGTGRSSSMDDIITCELISGKL